MKPAAFISMLFVLIACTATAQLTLLPQIGFDRSRTSIQYNDLSSFSPLGGKGNLKANLRLDYRFPEGYGPYVAFGTRPAVVEFSFTDPSQAINNFKATTASLQWKLEAGYQYTSKAISLGKSTKSATKTTSTEKRNCTSHFGCGARRAPKSSPTMNMRIQPSIGLAYVPSIKDDIIKSGGYTYNAGNWRTAVVPAMAFEFGKGRERIMTVSFNYTKGLSNLGTKSISETVSGKTVVNSFSSSSSAWGMSIGVPLNLIKTKKHSSSNNHAQKTNQKQSCRSRCESYRRCVKRI